MIINNIPNNKTKPGKSIFPYQAKYGKYYISVDKAVIIKCEDENTKVFYDLKGNRYFHSLDEDLYPITLDNLVANFSYENLPTWDDSKDWIDGPDNERIDDNEQPKTTFYVSGTYFVRFNVDLAEAKDIAAKFSITQIIWKGKQMFLVDGIWIGFYTP